MSLNKEGRKFLKLAAAKLREQEEEIEEYKKEAQRKELVEDIMTTLDKQGCLSSFTEKEKRAKLEEMPVDKLADVKQTINEFVNQSSIKIGEVSAENSPNGDMDAITSWLLYDS